MKLQIQTDELLAGCRMVASATASRTTIPILSHIKAIATADGKLTLMGADENLGIRYEITGVNVKKAGACIIPPQKLLAILNESSDEVTHIEATTSVVKIRHNTGKYELPNSDPDAFPDLKEITSDSHYQTIDSNVLKSALKRTLFSVSRQEGTRWATTGLLWEANEFSVTIVGTDTKRLSQVDIKANVQGEKWKDSRIIPNKTAHLIERYLDDNDTPVQVSIEKNAAMFRSGKWMIHSKLVEGRFPPYRDIIPKRAANKLPINAHQFAKTIRQASITTDVDSKRVEIEFNDGKITMSSRAAEYGSGEVEMDASEYNGEKVTIALDPSYVTDFFRANDKSQTATIEFNDGTKPIVFKIGDEIVYLVMPMDG